MRLLTYLFLFDRLVSVDAMPYPNVVGSVGEILAKRDGVNKTYTGEPPAQRTAYVVISLFFMMVLSLLLGMSRVMKLGTAIADDAGRGTIR